MQIDVNQTLQLRRSGSAVLVGILILIFLFGMSLMVALTDDEAMKRYFGWGGVLLFGAGLVSAAWRSRDPTKSLVTLGPQGICCARVSPKFVPWSAVEDWSVRRGIPQDPRRPGGQAFRDGPGRTRANGRQPLGQARQPFGRGPRAAHRAGGAGHESRRLYCRRSASMRMPIGARRLEAPMPADSLAPKGRISCQMSSLYSGNSSSVAPTNFSPRQQRYAKAHGAKVAS